MAEERKPDDSNTQQKEELRVYERLREETRKLLAQVHDRVNADTIREAVDKASARLKEAGGYTAEMSGKAVAALKKDMASTAERLGPKWEAFSEKSADLFGVWRDRGSVFLGEAAASVGAWLQKLSGKLEHQTYETGEMTYGGTFRCTGCGDSAILSRPGHLPACPRCGGTQFQRV
jgi:hypothetical protein